jgi:uncharacterized protein
MTRQLEAKEVFLDTGFVIALVSPRDHYHVVAQQLSESITSNGIRLITSQAVVLEIGAALSKLSFRQAAIRIIEAMQDDPLIEIVTLDTNRIRRAFDVFKHRTDKEWSLADCISFEIMHERGLTEALTPDEHFSQAGFTALMRA